MSETRPAPGTVTLLSSDAALLYAARAPALPNGSHEMWCFYAASFDAGLSTYEAELSPGEDVAWSAEL